MGILGMTEPCTGCLKSAFHDNHDSMPHWFWPVAGLLLWIVAILNFYPKNNTMVILAAQTYIASFHMGGVFLSCEIRSPSINGLCSWSVCGLRFYHYSHPYWFDVITIGGTVGLYAHCLSIEPNSCESYYSSSSDNDTYY